MEDALLQFGAVAGTIAGAMVFVKYGLKQIVPQLAKKVTILSSDEKEIKATFEGIAVMIGIFVAFVVYPDVSYLEHMDMIPTGDYVKIIDHILVGVICAYGQKGIADAFGEGKAWLSRVLKLLAGVNS